MFALNPVSETPVIETAYESGIDPGGYVGSVCRVFATTTGTVANGCGNVTVICLRVVVELPTPTVAACSIEVSFTNKGDVRPT
jgi:hypothetical protein